MPFEVTEQAESILRQSVSNFAGIAEHGCLLRWGNDHEPEHPIFEVLYKGSDPSTLKLLETSLNKAYETARQQFATA
jgi:hypothetical protein